MNTPSLRNFLGSLAFLICGLTLSGWAQAADPPSRVARLSHVTGSASFSPGGERDWGRAVVNRPLITGDRLWVDAGARAELQLGSAAIRIGGATSITLLNLDDRIVQVQLAQGTLNIRVRRIDTGQVFEIATPNLAYSIRRPGNYRIDVAPDGATTMVTVRSGSAEVYGEGRAFVIGQRQSFRFFGSDLRDYQSFAALPLDAFDRWTSERDRRWDTSPSRRYVSPEMIGYEDLDQHGTWRKVATYGNVWVPNRVSADWAPYRDGHWAWVEPWGWTWVDESPWGFAPSHYGRWTRIDASWAWVPGPIQSRPVYAPALVAFVGGSSFSPSSGGGTVGWFALGPRDVYRPSYTVSQEYFSRVNTSNTVITRTYIDESYNNRSGANVTYVNQQVPGALVAVLAAAFVQSRPVARETVRVNIETVAKAPIIAIAPIAPVRASILGAAAAPSSQPPEALQNRRVMAQVAPPPPPVPFAARQSALAANAGKPLEPAAAAALKPATPAPAPAVTVVAPTAPVAAPPKPASAPAPAAMASAPAAAPATATPPPPFGARPASAPPAAQPAPGAAPSFGARPASAPAAAAPIAPVPPASAAPTRPMPAPAPAASPTPAPTPPAATAPPARPVPPTPPAAPAPQPAPTPQAAPAPAAPIAPAAPPRAAPPASAPASAAAPAPAPAPVAPPRAVPATPATPASATPPAAPPPVMPPRATPATPATPSPAAAPPAASAPPAAPAARPGLPGPAARPASAASAATPASGSASERRAARFGRPAASEPAKPASQAP